MATNVSLIFIKTHKVEELKKFYELLGLPLKQEQHGSGPIHYSCKLSEQVTLEFYPVNPSRCITKNRIELTTTNLETIRKKVLETYQDRRTKTDLGTSLSMWDPEGRRVVITEKKLKISEIW